MKIKKTIKYFLFISILLFSFFFLSQNFNKKIVVENNTKEITETEFQQYNTNTFSNVNYVSTDSKGNNYSIKASIGQIDNQNNKIIFLTNVESIIELSNSEKINIKSVKGKYNSANNDTFFSENVIIEFKDYKMTGEYLDLLFRQNLITIYKNVFLYNKKNTMKADVINFDTQTKDLNIQMYKQSEKINFVINN